MRRAIHKLTTISFALALMAGCGGEGVTDIQGPTLSVSEAMVMVVDQLYINGGLDDEYSQKGEFSVYLRDAATGKDVACTRDDDGMDELSTPGVYYGGLSVPFAQVSADHPSEMARFQIVFVEQDSDGCPNPIDEDDDIAGTSAEFMFDGLLNQQIWAVNGRAAVVLRNSSGEARSVKSMAPALAEGLGIDKIYFKNGSDGDKSSDYYIFIDQVENGRSIYQCQISDDLMEEIHYGNTIYAALGFPVTCFSATDPDFANTNVRVGVYIQKSSGPSIVGETEAKPIGELIGEMAPFTNGNGYVVFQGVMTTPFSAPVIRLGELAMLNVNSLEYELTPSYNPTVELHITDSGGNYVIACAGEAQGLVGVSVPGSHAGLDANLVAADGQRELFGWSSVLLRLVDRKDGLKCPEPLGAEPTVLATTKALSSGDLDARTVQFQNGAGSVVLGLTTTE